MTQQQQQHYRRQAQPTAIERMVNLFADCGGVVPAEQHEYFHFQPLLQPFEDVLWSETESEYSDDGGGGGDIEDADDLETRAPPKQEELERQLRAAGKGHLADKSSYTPAEAVEVARVAGFAPDKLEESSAPSANSPAEPEDTPQFLLTFFRLIDRDHTGTLTVDQVQHVLTNLGDENALTAAECDAFFNKFDIRDAFDYEDLCRRLLERPATATTA